MTFIIMASNLTVAGVNWEFADQSSHERQIYVLYEQTVTSCMFIAVQSNVGDEMVWV